VIWTPLTKKLAIFEA